MRGTVLYGPRDVRFEERDEPKILKPTDAIIRLLVTCVCREHFALRRRVRFRSNGRSETGGVGFKKYISPRSRTTWTSFTRRPATTRKTCEVQVRFIAMMITCGALFHHIMG